MKALPLPLRCALLAWLAGAMLLLAPGCATVRRGPPSEPVFASAAEQDEARLRVLDQVWQRVDERFYDRNFNGAQWASARERHAEAACRAPSTEEFYQVINAMLAELGDAHTNALSPQRSWEKYTAARAMVGVTFEQTEHGWMVGDVRQGSPAARAGVRPGWIAVTRDGEALPTQGLSFVSVPGRSYEWQFLDHDNQLQQVAMVAEVAPTLRPPVEYVMKDGWVYLRFDGFRPDYQRWLRARLREHRDAPGVVLDLRYNRGGAVSSLERVINDFFPHSVEYGTFIRRGGKPERERSAWWGGADYRGRVAVLIGPGSASSAEVLAHVLQHYGRATLIGRPTAGAVVASRYHRLSDGGRLQLGMFDYRAPDGTRLEGRGALPDVPVDRCLLTLRTGGDRDLQAATQWLEQGQRSRDVSHLAAQPGAGRTQ